MKALSASFASCMAVLLSAAFSLSALASAPVVKTVPWVATNPQIPHVTYSGRQVTLKGTCDQQAANIRWTWDFGDGSPVATGTNTNKYAIEATHVYSGADNTIFTARLTIVNTTTGESASRAYYVQIFPNNLETQANVAIDEGLWYLHKTQYRVTTSGVDYGDWTSSVGYGGYTSLGYYGVTAANINAFEVNGHVETGDASNPYTDTVKRGLRRLFTWLAARTLSLQNNGIGSNLNPDSGNNIGNPLGVYVNQSYPYYQGGMFIDAIVASGTPSAVTTTGSTNIIGRTYRDIVQDMVDDHAAAQYDSYPGGGWRYSFGEYPDNSACQWAAIGMMAAERNWGCSVPQWVKDWNVPWLRYTQHSAGYFGYTDPNPAWGPFAVTPSGMVQLAFDGIGRGQTGAGGMPSWDKAETYMRDTFTNLTNGPTTSIKDYYYGMFSFVKSMLLHPGGPIVLLQSQTPGVQPIDWYAAETSKGDPTNGVARTLINDQSAGGYWTGHNFTGEQYPFETAWAVMMLHKTLFESGVPVAVGKALPSPGVVGQAIILDGSDSYHQDSTKSIVSWEWDTNSDGVYDAVGPFVTTTFAAVGNYPVKLRVTDNSSPAKQVEAIVTVLITVPPVAPTADAGGPYSFCPLTTPWHLDGLKSLNPDEGVSQPHVPTLPGDTIQEYAWDLDGDGQFDDATGPTPNVTAFFAARGPGSYKVYLRVTDTTALSFPDSGYPNLSSIATADVIVKDGSSGDCVYGPLTATPTIKQVHLAWPTHPLAAFYNVYRHTVSGGPYTWIQAVTGTTYDDAPGVLNRVYYYIVRPAKTNGDELVQSNEAAAEPLHPVPTVTAVLATNVSNSGRDYYLLNASSQSFGRMQLKIYIGDTASSQVAGPYFNDNIVRIRTGATPSVKPGLLSVTSFIQVVGKARIWAEDPIGQKSAEILRP